MSYNEMTKPELKAELSARGVTGISRDDKDELIRKLKVAKGEAVNITRPAATQCNDEEGDNDEPEIAIEPMEGDFPSECNESCPRYRRPDKECEACWKHRNAQE